jgi:hypothetical protein
MIPTQPLKKRNGKKSAPRKPRSEHPRHLTPPPPPEPLELSDTAKTTLYTACNTPLPSVNTTGPESIPRATTKVHQIANNVSMIRNPYKKSTTTPNRTHYSLNVKPKTLTNMSWSKDKPIATKNTSDTIPHNDEKDTDIHMMDDSDTAMTDQTPRTQKSNVVQASTWDYVAVNDGTLRITFRWKLLNTKQPNLTTTNGILQLRNFCKTS